MLEVMRDRATGTVGVASMVACGLAWLAALTAGPAAARPTAVSCGPGHAKTLAADGAARVYSHDGNVYGCARAGHESFRLGSVANSMSEGRAGPIALAGVDVAYGLTYYGVDTISADVVVRSLTDGAVLRRQNSYTGQLGPEYFETVEDIVVKRDGSVAWIASGGSVISGTPAGIEVEKSDRSSSTLLDKSKQIAKRSLRLHGSRLRWRDGRAIRHATLR
jgi:hypothetical protein